MCLVCVCQSVCVSECVSGMCVSGMCVSGMCVSECVSGMCGLPGMQLEASVRCGSADTSRRVGGRAPRHAVANQSLLTEFRSSGGPVIAELLVDARWTGQMLWPSEGFT